MRSQVWKRLVGKTFINLHRTKVYVFSDSVLCLGRVHQHPMSNEAWKKRIEGITTDKSYRDYDGINGEPTEFEWNIFPGFGTLQFCGKVKDFTEQIRRNTGNFLQEEFFSCRSSTSFLVERKTMKKSVWHTLKSYLCMQEGLEKDNGHLLFLVLRKSGTLSKTTVHKESGTTSRRRCCWNSQNVDVRFSVLRPHCLEVNSKSKGHGKLSIHFAATQDTIEAIVRIIVSAHQLTLYGAVAEMCEEYESFHDRSGRPDTVMDNQLCSVKSRQKFFWRVVIQHCSDMKSEMKSFHKQTE